MPSSRWRSLPWLLGGLLVTILLTAPTAEATFHLIKVREVHPGQNQDSYVQLQMYEAGENFLSGHSMTLYDSSGALIHTSTFSSSVPNGQNQRSVLVGDSGVQATFGVAPNLVNSSLAVPAVGGAACWNAGGVPADCVAWGNFTGGAALEAATGTSAGSPVSPSGIAAGKAIRRSIAPNCPTLLEESDDTDGSAADFAEATPAPRNNASPITEEACNPPNTTITASPPSATSSTDAVFDYEAPGATGFECRLDTAAFASCLESGIEYTALAEGSHAFRVRGVNAFGADPTPAVFTWSVDTTPPTAILDQQPQNPSSGAGVTFAFHADETGSDFECSLVPSGEPAVFSPCSSPATYQGLADGTYVFEVAAVDPAGNRQPTPTGFTWMVVNSATTPPPPVPAPPSITPPLPLPPIPQTFISGKPGAKTRDRTPTFRFRSDTPGAAFKCAIDRKPQKTCRSPFTTPPLRPGPHSFTVLAVAGGVLDSTPARFRFKVLRPAS